MASELVFRSVLSADGNSLSKVARMIYRDRSTDGVPELLWHREGIRHNEAISLAQVHEDLGTDTAYDLEYLKTDSGLCADDFRAVTWEGNIIGIVGPNFRPLQSKDFVDSFAPWIEAGHEMETAGFLAGGARMWGQIRLNVDPIEIRKGDAIKAFAMLAHGNDGKLGIKGGLVSTRIVCNNTLCAALSEGGFTRRKHTADVIMKASEVQDATMKLVQANIAFAEKAKFLASKNANSRTVQDFVFTMQNKPTGISEDLLKKEYERENSVLSQIESLFVQGRGNRGQDYWDIFNAWTERTTHGELNERKGESSADREGRRLDSMYFGTAATQTQKAFEVLLKMAKAA